ncbi:hypothetical protein BZA70DRAFT_255873 [Myxozyma melibiosi]|uniref:RFX-type winged-helix domain-containing protein n=1 Tax=Myxozyma melibiosi TaxID=54550 RepID=A0ABR1F8F5_9ASCO
MAMSMNRVVLAIRSNLPDEMDWALQTLVRMSFETPDDLHLERFPNLGPALLEKLNSIDQFPNFRELMQDGNDDEDLGVGVGSVTPERKLLDKILEAALVLRNAAINPENARYLSRHRVCQAALVKCLLLPDRPCFVELRQYSLDISESVALFMQPSSSQDPLFKVLLPYLKSDDRGVLIAAMRSVARLVISVEANLLQAIDPAIISRICALILLDDEPLLSVCLDFLYQYTSSSDNVELIADTVDWREPIQQLVRLLLYQAREWRPVDPTVPQVAYTENKPPPLGPPELPQSLISELLLFSEPERATQWMRVCFEEDPDGDVTQIALWKAYESRFEEFVAQGKKLLPAADFIKNVTMAFRNAAAMVVTLPGGQQKFIIKGIRPREVPLSLKGELFISCQWDMGGNTRCSGSYPSVQDLFLHILAVHVPPPRGAAKPEIYYCKWLNCTKFDPEGCTDRRKVAAHITTHIPDPQDNKPKPFRDRLNPSAAAGHVTSLDAINSQKLVFVNKLTVVDEKGEATGIPLTSVLILRNIARSDTGKKYLKGYIQELLGVAAVNVPLRSYLSDLLDHIVEKQRGAIV